MERCGVATRILASARGGGKAWARGHWPGQGRPGRRRKRPMAAMRRRRLATGHVVEVEERNRMVLTGSRGTRWTGEAPHSPPEAWPARDVRRASWSRGHRAGCPHTEDPKASARLCPTVPHGRACGGAGVRPLDPSGRRTSGLSEHRRAGRRALEQETIDVHSPASPSATHASPTRRRHNHSAVNRPTSQHQSHHELQTGLQLTTGAPPP